VGGGAWGGLLTNLEIASYQQSLEIIFCASFLFSHLAIKLCASCEATKVWGP
jgi:hypothetical protein